MADNIAYPGNPGLPKEVREKILSTFRHSLNLFKAGKNEDCAVGCEFILKMDPRFIPARRLLEKARDPEAGGDLAELESYVAETLTPMEKFGSTAPDKLLISAIEAYAERDFDRAIEFSHRVLAALPGNNDAREILEKATRKKELQPHVENFRQRALFALESGQTDEARRNFERMRSLDPEHPEVERLGDRLNGAAAPPGIGASRGPDAAPFDFPFGDLEAPPSPDPLGLASNPEAAAEERDPVFFAPSEPPPPAVEPPPAAEPPPVLDALSLDVPDWSPAGESGDSILPAAETVAAPETAPSSSFGDLWESNSPEISLTVPESPPPALSTGTSESPEIQRLLAEGDRLAEKGDPQGAIETWSRVFLSDLSNAEASSRIENARARLAESNRRVSDALKQGRVLYESGKPKDAREKFLEVLAIDENEATARSYLHRIEDDLARPVPSYDLAAAAPAGDVLAEEVDLAPSPAAEAGRKAPAPRSTPAARRGPSLLLVAVLFVVIGIGAYLALRPRGGAPPPAPAPAAAPANPITAATRLFQEGKVDEARAALESVPASSPQYARAQKMLATLGPGTAPPAGATGASAPASSAATASAATSASAAPPAAGIQRQEAEAALAQHRYIAALTAFHQSVAAFPDDAELKKDMALASEKVQEISPAVRLFNDGDYDSALPILWRLYQLDHQNVDVRSYLVRCYYNQGVIALQNNLFDKAAKGFSDALGVDPEDVLARRQKAFAERYLKKPADLLARVYLKYLRPRP